MPLYAFIQQRAGDHRRGRILAGVSLLDSLTGSAVSGLYVLIAGDGALALSPHMQIFLLAAVTLGMLLYGVWHIPHHTVLHRDAPHRAAVLPGEVDRLGKYSIPGGALMICNHLSYVDAVVLQIASPRPVRFVAFAGFAKSPFMRFIFRAAGVIPVTANKPMKGIRSAGMRSRRASWSACFPRGPSRAPGSSWS